MESWYRSDNSEESYTNEDDGDTDGCNTADAVAEFKTVSQIYDKLESWSDNECFDDLVEHFWLTIPDGNSDELVETAEYHQNIPYIRVGRNIGPHGKPAILIVSGAHAREWMGPLVSMYFVNRLIYELKHNNDATVTRLLEQVELIVVPLLNPDGTQFVNDGAELEWWWPNLPTQTTCESAIIWRKNRNSAAEPGEWEYVHPNEQETNYMLSSCVGVDLNRNWDWNRPDDPTTVDESICKVSFPGAQPESEVEVKGLKHLIEQNPHIIRILDIHHHHGSIWRPRFPEDMSPEADGVYTAVVDKMTEKMNEIHFTDNNELWKEWRNINWSDEDKAAAADDDNKPFEEKVDRWDVYETPEEEATMGIFKNWANANNILALTVELPPNMGPHINDKPADDKFFNVKPAHILPVGKETFPGILEFFNFQKHGDPDEDGVYDLRDNCIEEPNYLQRDCDGNGVGDACDSNNTCERHMMMVVDESTSMEERDDFTEVMRYQHVYAGGTATIIENYLQPGKVNMGIMDFNADPGCVSPGSAEDECTLMAIQEPRDGVTPDPDDINTHKAEELYERFENKYHPGGWTNIISAIDNGVKNLLHATENASGERTLFILTDGEQSIDSNENNLGWYEDEYSHKSKEERHEIFWENVTAYRDGIVADIKALNVDEVKNNRSPITINALAVTKEADIEMLAAFTTATNGHIGYANSSSDTPVYWKSVEALADEHIGTLEIGEIENPSNISLP